MNFVTYTIYNVAGSALWVCACTVAGYFFGNFDIVKDHFEGPLRNPYTGGTLFIDRVDAIAVRQRK